MLNLNFSDEDFFCTGQGPAPFLFLGDKTFLTTSVYAAAENDVIIAALAFLTSDGKIYIT